MRATLHKMGRDGLRVAKELLMKKTAGLAALIVVSLLVAVAAPAEEGTKATPSSTRPPRNLKKVGDHWTPWNPPQAGSDDYTVQQGDTLWDLGQKWLGNPFLWPQIWDQNRYIQDSHWIYPGDPLVKPGKLAVVPPSGPPPGVAEEEEAPPSGERPAPRKPEAVARVQERIIPLANARDIYCSGYIDPDHVSSQLWVAGREMERMGVANGDVIYLNQGSDQGLKAGMELGVLRASGSVVHPATGEEMGSIVKRLGRVRVLCAQENSATAVIVDACEPIFENDEVVPWPRIPVPQVSTMPPFDRCMAASGGLQGYVVAIKDSLTSAGKGHVIHTDLGADSGVRPGDFVTVYRDNVDLPRILIGQAMILTVEPGSSTAKVTLSVRELGVGDRVEVVQ